MEGEKRVLSELGEKVSTKSNQNPATTIANSPGAGIAHKQFLFYFQKKLVESNNCLNCGKRMFVVEAAAAAWEVRSRLGHNLGAKSLVAALQLHLRARVDRASNWPRGRPSLSHHAGDVGPREEKLKP